MFRDAAYLNKRESIYSTSPSIKKRIFKRFCKRIFVDQVSKYYFVTDDLFYSNQIDQITIVVHIVHSSLVLTRKIYEKQTPKEVKELTHFHEKMEKIASSGGDCKLRVMMAEDTSLLSSEHKKFHWTEELLLLLFFLF